MPKLTYLHENETNFLFPDLFPVRAFENTEEQKEVHVKESTILIIQQKRPPLIFLDWALKGGSAYDVLRSITNIIDYNPYIIFNTGYQSDNPEIPQEIINNFSIDKYLVKPLWECLRLHLGGYLEEAKLRSTRSLKETIIWFTDISRKSHRVTLESIVCIIKYWKNSSYKEICLKNESSIIVKCSWGELHQILQKSGINFFISNGNDHLIMKNHIVKYKRPFVWMTHNKYRIEIVKDRLSLFEKWIKTTPQSATSLHSP
ncbi:MAG TPA: hypothetical protein PLI67_01895 [Niabella sp.]|nr:hypothetical protein [Niabella sp.]